MSYNTAAIRKLLQVAFNDQELTILCFDHFLSVYDKFAYEMGYGLKIHLLIEYCDKQEEFDKLLALVKETNPKQYDKFFASKDYPEKQEVVVPGESQRAKISVPHPIVDRNYELETFITSLKSSPQQAAASILLIHDVSGQGKTKLIEHYKEHCWKHKIPVAHIDLKNGTRDPINILRSILIDLRPLSLPRCDEALRNTAGLLLNEQRRWWANSAQAFDEDLLELTHASHERFVFLFDTFNDAKAETKTWIADYELRMATPNRVSHLVVVVAGKQVPDPSGEWGRYSHILPLQPLQLDNWLEYAALVKSRLTPELIKRCYDKYGAIPAEMAKIINAFI
jgi:hypothetical protein